MKSPAPNTHSLNSFKRTCRVSFGLTMALSLGLSALGMSGAAIAAESDHQTVFRVKFGGVTVGNVTFGVSVDGKNYTFTGNGKTQGLAEWFAPGKAIIRSDGRLNGEKLIATKHFLSVADDKKKAVLNMAFKNGRVENVSLVPDKRKKRKNPRKYAVIQPEHLKNVVDPASTMIVPVELKNASNPNAVCGRTFKIYDGETRFDIKLSYKRNQKISTKGYDGYAYVCKLKYVPVAGHKYKHKNTKRMAANNDMEIWLAPISAGNETQSVFTAIRINIPTWIGTFVAEPDYFGPAKS